MGATESDTPWEVGLKEFFKALYMFLLLTMLIPQTNLSANYAVFA